MDLIYIFNIYILNAILIKKDIHTCFKDNIFPMDILITWGKLNKKAQYYAMDRRSSGIIHI